LPHRLPFSNARPSYTLFNMSEMQSAQQLSDEMVSMLRCPITRSALRREGDFLVSEIGGLRYPIRDGIPVMLAESAKLPEPFKTLDEFKARYGQPARPE
jgi:uncharacterized protein YbaR (Trm112 family)